MVYANAEVMVTKGTKIVGYVRVSSDEQGRSGLGLDAQKTAIRAACRERGWKLLRVEEDVQSGKRRKRRPGLEAARQACRDGEAGGIVAAKLDRLSRSMLDFAGLLADADENGYTVVVLDQDFDLADPRGKFTASILAAVAELERELIRERTRAALAAKRDRGEPLGRPREIGPELREKIYAMRHQGLGYRAIARRLNEEDAGGRRWHPGSVARIAGAIERRS